MQIAISSRSVKIMADLLKSMLFVLAVLNASSAQHIATCDDCCSQGNHKVLNDSRRRVESHWKPGQTPLCDKDLPPGWYRVASFVGRQLPTNRVSINHCGTMAPIWLDGKHPGPKDPVAQVKACVNIFERRHGCFFSFHISIKNCDGNFYLYFLQPTPMCHTAYCAEARTGETLSMRLYNRDVQPSGSELQSWLQKADLEGHGYKKEVTVKLRNGPGSVNTDIIEESHLYFKIIKCFRAPKIEQELNTLIPGVFGDEVAAKLNQEINFRQLNKGKCKAGLSIVLKGRRRNKRAGQLVPALVAGGKAVVKGALKGAGFAAGKAIVESVIEKFNDNSDSDDSNNDDSRSDSSSSSSSSDDDSSSSSSSNDDSSSSSSSSDDDSSSSSSNDDSSSSSSDDDSSSSSSDDDGGWWGRRRRR